MGLDNSLLWGLSCVLKAFKAASLTSVHHMPVVSAPLMVTTKATSRHCQAHPVGSPGLDEGASWYKLLNSDGISSWFPQAGKTPTDLVQLWQADTRQALEHPEPGAEQNGLEGPAESVQETPQPVPAQ